MRAFVLTALAAAALAACNDGPAANNSTSVDETLTAESIGSNDTTAIDAVTNDAAQMAADVNFIVNEGDLNATGNAATGNAAGNNSL
jgi:hypothetical protein